MSLNLDQRDYFDSTRLYHHNRVTVTLTRPASYSGGAAASITVNNVQERPATQEDVDSPLGGSLDGTRRYFHLWRVECLAMPPFNSYEITTADGKVWVIKKVETLAHGRRFRCHCLLRNDTAP